MGDLEQIFLEESNHNKNCGVGKNNQRDTTGINFITWRSEIAKLQSFQDRDPKRKKNQFEVIPRAY